jgi:hypothetical protein
MTATDSTSGAVASAPVKWQLWTGRVLGALPVFMLAMSATMKLAHPASVAEMFVGHLGYREGMLAALAIVEIACTITFLVPQTAVLGAVLLTGYLGGAVATHVRVGDAFTVPLLLGIMVWGSLFFRDARVRALLPIRGISRS